MIKITLVKHLVLDSIWDSIEIFRSKIVKDHVSENVWLHVWNATVTIYNSVYNSTIGRCND
jgi:hypothetical protein